MAEIGTDPIQEEIGTETKLCRVRREDGSFGGYKSEVLAETLSDTDKNIFECSRCKGIMREATIFNTGFKKCESCIQEGEKQVKTADIRNKIHLLSCVCPLAKRGCDWVGILEQIEDHLIGCGHMYVSCQLLCGVVITRGEVDRHVREICLNREEKCLYCREVLKACDLVAHVEVCGKVVEDCELGCGTRATRRDMVGHRENECLQEVVVCPFEKYGCEMRDAKRSELEQHLEANRIIHTELKLNSLEEKFTKENETLKQQLLKLRTEFREEMKIKSQEIEILKEESRVREEDKFVWNVKNFKNTQHSEIFVIGGYRFRMLYSTNGEDSSIHYCPLKDFIPEFLKWPFRAVFTTQLVCHKGPNESLRVRSPIIEVSREDMNYFFHPLKKLIASFPPVKDLKDFIREERLMVVVTVRIFKNI